MVTSDDGSSTMSNNTLMGHHVNNSMIDDHTHMHNMMNDSMLSMNHSVMDHGSHHHHHMMPGMDHVNNSMDHVIDRINHTMSNGTDHDHQHMMEGHDHMMGGGTHSMYFSFNFPGVLVLQEWSAVTNTEIIISLLGLCIMAIFLESIARLTKRASSKTLCYMAKKNLKSLTGNEFSVNMTHSAYQKLPTNSDNIVDKDISTGTSGAANETSLTSPESKKMIGVTDDKEGTRSLASSDVPLTFPQCLQYRVLLTSLHVAHVLLGYFLMLAVMTFNWWILVAVLAGSVLGYLLFGWGTHSRTLDLIASSTLPPKYMSKSSLNDLKGNSEVIHQEPCLNSLAHGESTDGTLLVGESVTTMKNDSQCIHDEHKVDIRVNLQGESVLESEFTKRLDKSKETVL